MRRSLVLVVLIAAGLPVSKADVTLPRVISDSMVLQRGRQVPIWGTAAPGEKVKVEFGGQAQSAVADTAGKWRVNLRPLTASASPRDLKVTAKNSIVVKDVVVGDVWVLSGQSNMVY